MTAEERHIAEIERIKKAIEVTKSKVLKHQYTKHLRRLQKELKEYRYWQRKGD